jgi:hypothetical protein
MAIIKKYFVSAQEVKIAGGADFNVDDSKLNPFILKAQDAYIGGVLNSDFYNHLMLAATNNTLTQDETDLINDYIKPALLEWAILTALPHIKTGIVNKGVGTESAQYYFNADRADYKEKKDEIRNFADYYTKRLEQYLCDYYNLFPLYKNPSDKVNQKSRSANNFGGFYMPNRRPERKDEQYRN